MMWLCLTCCCVKEIGREKVKQHMKNLEHDNYRHALTMTQVMTVGIVAFILQVSTVHVSRVTFHVSPSHAC